MWADEGIAVNNGTSAPRSLKLKFVPEMANNAFFTIISCATAIIEAGGKPVLVDLSRHLVSKYEQMKEKINNKTSNLVVHMFGHPAEMDPIIKVVKRHKLYLIEDAAEAMSHA